MRQARGQARGQAPPPAGAIADARGAMMSIFACARHPYQSKAGPKGACAGSTADAADAANAEGAADAEGAANAEGAWHGRRAKRTSLVT